MKNILAILFAWPVLLFAQQKPFINSISPTSAEVGKTITISGANLSNIIQVSFGDVHVSGADINVISNNLIEATVPPGATRGTIIVRSSNNLVGESSEQFYISFSGIANSSWKDEFLASISPNKNVYDVCLCDLNNDGKSDAILTHNLVSGTGIEATVFENQSTLTNESFVDIGLGDNSDNSAGGFISVTCADLDSDGDKDVIFTTDNTTNIKQIYIYENTSGGSVSLSYLSSLSLSLPTASSGDKRVPRRVNAADIDGDGKLDIVVGNENDNTFHIFPNNSTPGSFAFSSPIEVTVGEAGTTGGIDIGDLDNDGKQDVVIIPAVQSNEQIYVLRNESIPGTFNFSLQEGITSNNQRRNVMIADFDNDGLNDIAATADATLSGVTGSETVTIYKNTTSGSVITFGSSTPVTIPSNLPWGLDAGDLNGDGLLDIAVATLGSPDGAVYTIENSSSGGTISFENPVLLTVSEDARNIRIGDLNGDSKPDIAYSHDTRTGSLGDLGVRINETCIDPTISPESFSFCTGDNFTLSATNSVNGTYVWSITSGTGTVVSQSNNEATFNITSAADAEISLQITGQAGCSSPPTKTYVASFEPGSVTSTPSITITDAGAVCAGDNVILSTTSTFSEYTWTLPDGSTSNSSTISISSVSSANAGEYQLSVRNDGACSSQTVTSTLSVSQPPLLEIINNNLDNFCTGTSVTLEIPDYSSDFNFQWYKDNTAITSETGVTFTTNESGTYRVDVINPTDNCITRTAEYSINAIAPPTSVANGPSEICVNNQASFTSASSGSGSFALQYDWAIEDASNTVIQTGNSQNLDYTFTSAGTYNITLRTSYDPSEVYAGANSTDLCVDSNTISIVVSDPPTATLDQVSTINKCQGDVILVGLSSPNLNSVDSYSWTVTNTADNSVVSTGSDETIEVSTAVGIESVQVSVDITTSIGCRVTSNSILINNFQSDLDISSSDFTSVVDFDSALLEDATAINLAATNAVSDISWEPAENFSDPTNANTIFFPQNPTTTVTLNAIDNNGCPVSTEIRVVLDNIRPKRTFSPNGDNMNDCWEILNIGDLGTQNGCKVYVFDSRGRNILVKEEFELSNNCVWDGNFNSSPVPEGVYYYVLKCNSSEFTKSGSILLAR